MKNTIEWIAVADALPDDSATVLLYDATASEPVWPGWLDTDLDVWFYVDSLTATPTHWAEFPAGPNQGEERKC